MRISLLKSTQSGNSGEIIVHVKVSSDDNAQAELLDSHSFDLRRYQEDRPIAAEVFTTEPPMRKLRDYGKRLSKALFSSDPSSLAQLLLQQILPNGRILLELNGDGDLDVIPWEYAWTGQAYLVNQCMFTRIHNPTEHHLLKLSLRIVVVTPDPIIAPTDPDMESLPDLHLKDQFQNFIDGHYASGKQVVLERAFPPTVNRMNSLLMNDSTMATVLHFMGHCRYKDTERALVFEHKDTGKLDFVDTMRLVDMPKSLRLAFLCACDTRGVARVLAEAGVPYAIGSYCSIPDDLARKFESNFYQLLASGCTVEKAMWRARLSLMDDNDIRHRDYFPGAMILYSSTFRENDGTFECEMGKLKVKLHMPLNNIKDVPTTSIFYGRRQELCELNSKLRDMVGRGGQSCRVYTITGIGAKGKTALAVETIRRTAHLFPGGIFAWPFDCESLSFTTYLWRLVEIIFPDEVQSQLRKQYGGGNVQRLGSAIIRQFVGYPTCLLVLDHADILRQAEISADDEAVALGKWLRQVASASDIAVKILATSGEPLGWSQEETVYLNNFFPTLGDKKLESKSNRRSLGTSDDIDLKNTTETMATETIAGGEMDCGFEERKDPPSASENSQLKEFVKYPFYGVPAENYTFVDRPSILANMESALGGSSPLGGCKIVALRGLGGMGKTQLMLQYCYLHRATYDFVFWLEVDNWNSAIDGFRKLAINLGLSEESTKGEDSETKVVDWVRSWLQMKRNWLLLLDNADDEMHKKVFKLLPRIGGDIILTTREYIPLNKATVIHVEKMQEEEAIALLLGNSAVYSHNQESARFRQAQEIAAILDCMPLALDMARAYVSNTHSSFQRYLSMFKTKSDILLQYQNEDSSDQYGHTVETVWQLSLERVQAQNPIAVHILEICSFLQSESIPARLFEHQHSVFELVSTLSAPPVDEQNNEQSWESIRQAIAVLVKFSFVTRALKDVDECEESPANDLLTIHRLVQKVIYNGMKSENRIRWAHKIAAALKNEAEFSDPDVSTPHTRKIMDIYLPHMYHFLTLRDTISQKPFTSKDLCRLMSRGVDYLTSNWMYFGLEELCQLSLQISEATYGPEHWQIADSLSEFATFYWVTGRYSEAEPLFQRALEIVEKAGRSEHLPTMYILNNLALLYNSQGKYEESEPLFKRALAINEKIFGLEHPDSAGLVNNLALLYDYQAKYDEAELLYSKALAIRQKLLGLEHQATAMTLSNMAWIYTVQSKYDKADSMNRLALEIREKILGAEHPDIAQSLNNLAINCKKKGKYVEAELYFQRALALNEKVLGSDHPTTALALSNLGELYSLQARYDEVTPMYQRSLAITEKMLGSTHPTTAKSINNLARDYERLGKYGEAEPMYQQALASYEKASGPEHPNTAHSLSCLAGLYSRQGKYDKAEQLYQRALAICEKVYGSEHPDTAHALNNLAELYYCQGKYKEAETLHQRALVIHEKVLGSEHPDTAGPLNSLARLYKSQNKYDEAEPLHQRALAIHEKILGAEHPDTAGSLNNLGRLYKSQAKYGEASLLHQRALAIHEKVLGSEHPETAVSLNNLAELYISQGKYDEAEPLHQKALTICEKTLGSQHPNTAMALNSLAALYESQGKYDEAEPLYQQALAIREKVLEPEHPDTAESLNNLALLYNNQGKYGEAEPLCRQALTIREKKLGLEHSDTATSLNSLALIYSNEGKFSEAELMSQRALAIREKAFGSEHPDIATSLNSLALLNKNQGKLEEAESFYRRGLTMHEKTLGLAHPNTATSLSNLAALCVIQGKYEKAEPLYVRALAIREGSFNLTHPYTVQTSKDLRFVREVQDRLHERARRSLKSKFHCCIIG